MKIKAIIEIPENSKEKIEIKNGVPVVDRLLSIPVPANYGYVLDTLAEDGDALDIFVISNHILKTAQVTEVTLVGLFKCTDQGIQDDKLVGVLSEDKFDDVTILKNLAQIGHYLINYKPNFVVENYRDLTVNPDPNLLDKYYL